MNFLTDKKASIFFLYLATFIVAFCSIVYELLLAHSVSLVAGSAITWYGLIIGSYLGSLGLGSFFVLKLIKRKKLLASFIQVELLLVFFGSLSAVAVYFFQMFDVFLIVQGSSFFGKIIFLGGVFSIVFLIGFLSGIELPLLMEIGEKLSKKSISNRVLAADYFGSLFGAVLFPLLLVPKFNVFIIGFIVASANLAVALASFWVLTKEKKRLIIKFTTQLLVLFLLITLGFWNSIGIEQYFAKKYYYYLESSQDIKSMLAPLKEKPEVERIRSKYQVIDLVRLDFDTSQDLLMNSYRHSSCSFDWNNKNIELYLNGDWQLNIGTEKVYHEYFTHVPIQLNGKIPEKVLVLGGGDGMLDRELLKYENIKKITHVDLDGEMIRLAKENEVLKKINQESLFSDRVETIVGDGFSFVKNTTEKFDAIYVDFPTPMDYNTAKLYSREFYSFVKEVLSEEGFVAYDIPGAGPFFSYDKKGKQVYRKDGSPLPSYYATIRAAGFETIVPFLSRLEQDNEQALIIARDYLSERQLEINEEQNKDIKNQYLFRKKQEARAKEYVKNFTTKVQEGFIFAKKNKANINKEFNNHDVQMCLLNKERFLLSLEVSVLPEGEIDKNQINSIMRPKLPLAKFSQIRLPYQIQ